MFPPPEAAALGEFSSEERALLLDIAHRSIDSALAGQALALDPPSPHLSECRGVFTTLYLDDQLKGCVGYVFATAPLFRTVAETAQAAAFQDPRFPPVAKEEAANLRISLSILSTLSPIAPDEVEVGKHGLLVTMAGRRGLLLPQVPVEHGWDRREFLEQTCHKAGLPRDACKAGAKLEAFTAEVFGEEKFRT